MNIFVTDENPFQAARNLCDLHVPKMVVESGQLICTALHFTEPQISVPYKVTHKNHPCNVWLREHPANLLWLWEHFDEMCREYTLRFGRVHLTQTKIASVQWQPPLGTHHTHHTPFAMAMPPHLKLPGDPVGSYRQYYLTEKRKFAKWRLGPPDWWIE